MSTRLKLGDVILSGSEANGFVVRDAVTNTPVGTPVKTLRDALQIARSYGGLGMWQQNVDKRGRPLGPPTRLPLP